MAAERNRERFPVIIKVFRVLRVDPLRGYSDILSGFKSSDIQMTGVGGLKSVNNQRIFIACLYFYLLQGI